MDVLSDILDTMRLKGTLYFSAELHQPWGIRVPAFRRVARFHLVVRGSLWVWVTGQAEPKHLETGDLILIPHGAEHILACSTESPVLTVDEVVKAAGFTGRGTLVHGGADGGAPTRLICGHFAYDEGLDHSLLAQLPASLVVQWEREVRDSPLEDAFRFITREVQSGRPGHESVVRRLSEVLFFQAVRAWADRTESTNGLLAALGDPRLCEALSAMHEDPAHPWTLDLLSRRAAMGRSAFAERFREVVGETPLRYLTKWRVQRAKRLLAESQLSRDRIAELVGYESAASMSRVFRKTAGVSPGVYRRTVREQQHVSAE
ncbi:MAG: AraC family transcriptional regulator [Gemmatimonadaceae bacterium]|nr:AraC family transcriptional regulator [Gemmatimonadaceae bacterium]